MKNNSYPENIIVMKVGPHSGMSLSEIVDSKKEEEINHGVHYWGYSGVFCHPKKVQELCKQFENDKSLVKLILVETKSDYDSKIGFIKEYSIDGIKYNNFLAPVQLQGAQFALVAKNIKVIDNFSLDNYVVYGGKNDGKPLSSHLKFRVNKSFAKLNEKINYGKNNTIIALETDLVYPYAVWLREKS